MIDLELPLRLPSPNETRGEHWSRTSRRAELHKLIVTAHIRWRLRAVDGLVWPGWHVTLTRLSPGRMDPGNFEITFKHVQDGVAQAIGVPDERDPRYRWSYGQEKTKAFGVRIRVEKL